MPLDSFVGREKRLQNGQNLQAPPALAIGAPSEQRPQISPKSRYSAVFSHFALLGEQKESPASLPFLNKFGFQRAPSINRPKVKTARQTLVVGRAPEERPYSARGLAFASRKDNERPRQANLPVFLFPIFGHGKPNRPRRRERISPGRPHRAKKRQQSALVFGIFRADSRAVTQVKRPGNRQFFMAADQRCLSQNVCFRRDSLGFPASQRPKLPSSKPIAAPQMKERRQIVARYHVVLSRADIQRKGRRLDFIAPKAILHRPVKRKERPVVSFGISRFLPEIKREKSRSFPIARLPFAAGQMEKLQKAPAPFLSVAVITHQGIKNVPLAAVWPGASFSRKKNRNGKRTFSSGSGKGAKFPILFRAGCRWIGLWRSEPGRGQENPQKEPRLQWFPMKMIRAIQVNPCKSAILISPLFGGKRRSALPQSPRIEKSASSNIFLPIAQNPEYAKP